jgi:hypothetical protein
MTDEALSSHEDDDDRSDGPGGAPPATFEFLVHTLFTQALMALGRIPNPITKQAVTNLPTAKHFVGMLAMLEEKTKGNLDRDDRRLLDEAQHQLRVLVLQATGSDPGKAGRS